MAAKNRNSAKPSAFQDLCPKKADDTVMVRPACLTVCPKDALKKTGRLGFGNSDLESFNEHATIYRNDSISSIKRTFCFW